MSLSLSFNLPNIHNIIESIINQPTHRPRCTPTVLQKFYVANSNKKVQE